MARKSTILWRVGVLGMILAVVPVAVFTYDRYNAVDSDAMLNVSVSTKTISHLRIETVGDSV